MRLLEVEIDVARVQLAHAQLEDAGDVDDRFAAFAGIQAQLVADAQAEVAGQLLADHCVARTHQEAAGDQVVGQRDDALITRWIDAQQRHGRAGDAAPGDGRAADHRRHRENLRVLVEDVTHVLPVDDRTQTLGARAFQYQRPTVGGGWKRAVDLVRGQDADVGLGAEGSLDDVGLQAGDQGGNEDDHRRTDGDAEGDQQRLHAVVQQEA